jgi:DNA-binding protein HU
MNKQELINYLSEKAGVKKVEAERVLSAFTDFVESTLAKGESLTLVGFGKFEVRDRAARTGRNPQTGEPLAIAATKVPAFKPGKLLKDAVK